MGQATAGQSSAQVGSGGAGAGSGAVGPGGSAGPAAGNGESGSGRVPGEASPAGSATDAPGAIASHVVPPRVIRSSGTEYPGDAFRLMVRRQDLGTTLTVEGAEGTVGMRTLVRADGVVSNVEVTASSGSSALDRAAVEAVRRWLFAPATRDGAPIDAYVTFGIRYVVR